MKTDRAMEKIKKIWFADNRVFVQTEDGKEYGRPLEAFPVLMDATEAQREDCKIGRHGDDVRWDSLDEDIHISSFFARNEPRANRIGEIFGRYPQINVSAFANRMGINKSLMAKYIYGIKTPSEKRSREIVRELNALGEELSLVRL